MCGRYKQTSPFGTLAEFFGIKGAGGIEPAGLLAPGMMAPVFRGGAIVRQSWGFVPHWKTEQPKLQLINARLETLHEKASFRNAPRCLIPANGFFEWDHTTVPRQPYDFHLVNDAPFAFAGVWDAWKNPATGEWQETFAIVTTAPNAAVAKIHDRMPLILTRRSDMDDWMNMKNLRANIGDSVALQVVPVRQASVVREEGKLPEKSQFALFK